LVLTRLDYGNATLAGVASKLKQSTRQTAVCDECCWTARLFSTEMRPHHTAAPGPSLVTRPAADRIQARCACLPLLAWYWYGCAIPCTRTARGADMDSRRRLCSASTFELNIPPTRHVTVGDRDFGVAAARVWNSLPSDVTVSPSLSVFKRRLKTSVGVIWDFNYQIYCTAVCVQYRNR